jgi:7,8-dihydroneopterin 2',3'-cyclic phosphate phosphodiesterase
MFEGKQNMKRLIELAQNIKDEELKKKVVEFLKDPKLSNKDFKKYPCTKIEEAGSMFTIGGPAGTASVERDVLNHTVTLTNLCISTTKEMEKNYGITINKDYLIAAALLHDIAKTFEWKRGKQGLEHTGVMLDHTMLATAELYARGFPEGVIHIVAAHFGESGPTAPRNLEALLMHHLDNMISLVEFHICGNKKQEPMQLILLDEETIKKIAGGGTEKKSK